MLLWSFIGIIAYITILFKFKDSTELERKNLYRIFIKDLFSTRTGFLLSFILGPVFWSILAGYWLGRGLLAAFDEKFDIMSLF